MDCGLLIVSLIGVSCTGGRPLDGPVTIHVSAKAGWQRSGVSVRANQDVTIEYVRGEVRDADTVIRDAAGSGYVCGSADCCEPLPDTRRSALIARVGRDVWAVGNSARHRSPAAGTLLLRINDCDEGLYDNAGELEILISPSPVP